jgi:hypothetical protein
MDAMVINCSVAG